MSQGSSEQESAGSGDGRLGALHVLRQRELRLYVVARFFSGAAMTLLFASLSWQVFEVSGSAFQLGVLGLVRFFPQAGLSLLGGALADTFDRRRIVIVSQLVPLVCATALAAATWNGTADLLLIYCLVAAVAIAGAFESPARSALLPALVPRHLFPDAVTVYTTTQALAFVTGPALAGLVIAEAGLEGSYAVHSLLVAISISALVGVRALTEQSERSGVNLAAIREGLAFVRKSQVVLGAMTLDMFAVIFGGAQALLPIYANEILQVGARGYGLLAAALELGALIMALVLVVLPPIRRVGRVLLLAVSAYGLATMAFGLSHWFPISIAAYMAVGMADQVSVVCRHSLIQLATPDGLRGRVNSVNMVFIGASNQLGAVEAGFVASFTSAPFAVVSGGAACLAVLVFVAVRLPELRRHVVETRAEG